MTRRRTAGFTLVELVISLALAAVLLGILLPALSSARMSSHLARCAANQKMLGQAWHICLDSRQGEFPFVPVQPGWRYGGVRFSSLDNQPFLDPERPLNEYLPVERLDAPAVDVFACPADRGITDVYGEVGTGRRTAYQSFGTSFRANALLLDARQAGLATERRGVRQSEITTPPARLAVMGDAVWFEALEETGRLASWHGKRGAGNMLFLDGSVHFLTIEPRAATQATAFEPVLP